MNEMAPVVVAAASAISDEPAYVLHRYDWSESSLILEVFTRHHGRIALVAKGAKRPSSSFRPVLLPLQPLHLTFGGDAEIRTLKGAEWMGGHVMPTGEALLSGYYLNELLMRLLARDDPHPGLFDAYAAVVQVLASRARRGRSQPALRAFELLLLREIGLLPALDAQTLTWRRWQPDARYSLVPEAGLRRGTRRRRPRQPRAARSGWHCSARWTTARPSPPTLAQPAPASTARAQAAVAGAAATTIAASQRCARGR